VKVASILQYATDRYHVLWQGGGGVGVGCPVPEFRDHFAGRKSVDLSVTPLPQISRLL
jgi:hypothetical protein